MDRVIKFRGLRTDGKGWVYGHYRVANFIEGVAHIISNWFGYDIEVIPSSVGQFTGLKDKNGVEIYEGDVIHFTWFSYGEYELETEYKGDVMFINGSFMFCCSHGNYPFSELEFNSESDIEVIGNIHEQKGGQND